MDSTTKTYNSVTPGMPIGVFLEEKTSDLDAPQVNLDAFSIKPAALVCASNPKNDGIRTVVDCWS